MLRNNVNTGVSLPGGRASPEFHHVQYITLNLCSEVPLNIIKQNLFIRDFQMIITSSYVLSCGRYVDFQVFFAMFNGGGGVRTVYFGGLVDRPNSQRLFRKSESH